MLAPYIRKALRSITRKIFPAANLIDGTRMCGIINTSQGDNIMKYTLRAGSNRKIKRTHGFLKRMRDRHGRAVLSRRRRKGRRKLTV